MQAVYKLCTAENKRIKYSPESGKYSLQILTGNGRFCIIQITIEYRSANAQEMSRHIECKDLILHIGHGT